MPSEPEIKALFERAMELPEGEWARFVRAEAGDDTDLAAEVLSLLEHAAEGTTQTGPLREDRRSGFPDCIGHYKILGVLGEGGFGMVYEAEQTEPVKRRVAVKVIKAGMDSRSVVSRFEAERQALAVMDHPCVAKIFDGGLTEPEHGSRPYFAMELVRGEPITDYCDKNRLSIEARVDLFKRVCEAVQHAHSKGVIHRDLKPSNIMVSHAADNPSPKVIDFGIAKATNQQLTEATIFTEQGQMIGTPEYMSPEQAEMSGTDIDTRSDIYSLGVILYELLSGRKPFEPKQLRQAGLGEIQRIIREDDPPRPSTRVSTAITSDADLASKLAKARQSEPRQLEKRLRGELDWVVMKCLAKERERRYESAHGLAIELERYLTGDIVQARPPSRVYRARKFARKNKAAATAAVVIGAVLLVAAGLSLAFALEADSQRNTAELALVERDEALGAEIEQREIAENAHSTAEFAQAEAQARADELEQVANFQQEQLRGIDAELMGVRLRAAIIEQRENAITRIEFEDEPSREAALQQSLAELDAALVGVNFTDLALGSLEENIFERSLKAIETQFTDHPLVQAGLLQTLADTLRSAGLYQQAQQPQLQALAIRRSELGNDSPKTLESVNSNGLLFKRQRRFDEAEVLYRESLDSRRRVLGENSPDTISSMQNLGLLLLETDRPDEAGVLFRQAFTKATQSLGESHEETLSAAHNLGFFLDRTGDLEPAAEQYQHSVELRREALGPEDPRTLGSLNNLGDLLRRLGRYEEAEVALSEALAGRRRAFGNNHKNTIYAMSNLGLLYKNLRRYDLADPLFVEASQTSRRVLGPDHHDALIAFGNLGSLRRAQGRLEEAAAIYSEILDRRRRTRGDRDPITVSRMSLMAGVLRDLGRFPEAERVARQTIEAVDETEGPSSRRSSGARRLLAEILVRMDRFSEAEPYFHEVLRINRDRYGAGHQKVVPVVERITSLLNAEGMPDRAEIVWNQQIAALREEDPVDEPLLASALVQTALCQLEFRKYKAAEHALTEALRIRSAILPPESWLIWNTQSLLGESISSQSRFAEAEPLLVESAENIDPPESLGEARVTRLAQAHQRVIDLYTAWHAAKPGAGHDVNAGEWQSMLDSLQFTTDIDSNDSP